MSLLTYALFILCILSTWLTPIEDIVDFVFESNNDSKFCMFESLIGTDMTYHFSVDVPLRI